MFLKVVDFASQRCVASELVNLEAHLNRIFTALVSKKTIEKYFSALDFKKWRIAHTFVVSKSDDL